MSYNKLHFFLWDASPKAYCSNLRIRKCFEDNTPILYKTENVLDYAGKFHHKSFIQSADGTEYMYQHLFLITKPTPIEKHLGNWRLLIFHRFGPCTKKFYQTLDEAAAEANSYWEEEAKKLHPGDIEVIDHTKLSKWIKNESIENYVKKNKCTNPEVFMSHQGKALLHWDNYQVAF